MHSFKKSTGSLFVIVSLLLTSCNRSSTPTQNRQLDSQVEIPAGTYPIGDPQHGSKAVLSAFEIDKYEVTIGEYSRFIAWCEQNATREHEFDHPRGDRATSHVNKDVKLFILKATEQDARIFKQEADSARGILADPGVKIDPSCPMVGVTFWDAYAYAHWRGKL